MDRGVKSRQKPTSQERAYRNMSEKIESGPTQPRQICKSRQELEGTQITGVPSEAPPEKLIQAKPP